jgi:hypothetical protein
MSALGLRRGVQGRPLSVYDGSSGFTKDLAMTTRSLLTTNDGGLIGLLRGDDLAGAR